MSFKTHPDALGLLCGLFLKELKEGKWVSDGGPWLVIIPYGTELCKQLLLAEQHVPWAEKREKGSSLVVWKVLLCHITRLTLLPVCCTERQWECRMTFHGNVCFDELTQKDGQHLRVCHMSTPVLEQNLSPESKSIGFKEQLTLNRQMNDPHFLSLQLLNLLPSNTCLWDVQHKRN